MRPTNPELSRSFRDSGFDQYCRSEARSARVVIPEPDAESDEEPLEDASIEEVGEEGDFLADFPDDTEVCSAPTPVPDSIMALAETETDAPPKDLELVHVRIGSLAGMRLPRFAAHLKRMCLRQNFISQLDPEVFHLLTKLEELDFYDNKLKTIGDALDKLEDLG